jgi:hypothetical protein
MGGLEGPPKPPTLRAPAKPWRSATVQSVMGPHEGPPHHAEAVAARQIRRAPLSMLRATIEAPSRNTQARA